MEDEEEEEDLRGATMLSGEGKIDIIKEERGKRKRERGRERGREE